MGDERLDLDAEVARDEARQRLRGVDRRTRPDRAGLGAGVGVAGLALIAALVQGMRAAGFLGPSHLLAAGALSACCGLAAWILRVRAASTATALVLLPALFLGGTLLARQSQLIALHPLGAAIAWLVVLAAAFWIGWSALDE